MYEKVNPSHPDKIADRIAGALVDMAYKKAENPRIAVEVLIGHGKCHIIAETSERLDRNEIAKAVRRICGAPMILDYQECMQDKHLAENQTGKIRCGDNGIFKGTPVTQEQRYLADVVKYLYERHPSDGKYLIADGWIVACQSNVKTAEFADEISNLVYEEGIANPLGDWTGGTDVDTGATNRKLGSDMGDSVTGGGLHGKDLSKGDVSINIYAWQKAQQTGKTVEISCAIGDEEVDGIPYAEIVEQAREYIRTLGGFEKFAEWGLI